MRQRVTQSQPCQADSVSESARMKDGLGAALGARRLETETNELVTRMRLKDSLSQTSFPHTFPGAARLLHTLDPGAGPACGGAAF